MLEIITKVCSKCKVDKSVDEFTNLKSSKDGKHTYCRTCYAIIRKEYRINNIDKVKERQKKEYQNNKEKILAQRKEYYEKNKEDVLQRVGRYTDINREKINLRQREFRKQNLEHVKSQDRKKYVKFKEQILEQRKIYYKENKEAIAKYKKAYYYTPKGNAISKNKEHRRRSIKKDGDVTTEQMMELQNNAKTCYWCNCSLKNKKIHIDHYVALSKGGQHTISNLVVSCAKCNLTKQADDPIEFANKMGKLL